MRCQEFRELVESYLDEDLDEARREGFRRHLVSCAVCRQAALESEPTLLFATLEPTEGDSQEVERCVTAVNAGIRQERLTRRLQRPRRPWLAAAAAFLAGAGVVATWQAAREAQAPATASAVATPTTEVVADGPVPPPEVRVDMPGEGVRVYQFADQVDRNTAVYYIVTPALES